LLYYSDAEIVYIIEEFDYLEKGNFSSGRIIKQLTVADILKENSNYKACSDFLLNNKLFYE